MALALTGDVGRGAVHGFVLERLRAAVFHRARRVDAEGSMPSEPVRIGRGGSDRIIAEKVVGDR